MFFTNVTVTAFTMAAGILVARRLGPDLRGQWGLVLFATNVVGLFHLGIGPAITYFTGKNERDRSTILTFAIVSALVLGIVFSSLFFILYPHIHGIWDGIPRMTMLIGLAVVPLTFLVNFYRQFLLGMLKVTQGNLLDIIRSVLYLLFVIVLVWLLRGTVLSTAISFTGSIFITAVLGILIFTRDLRPAGKFDTSLVGPISRYGSKAYVIIVLFFLNYRLDVFLIKYFMTNSDVAFYQIAVGIAERMWYIPNALNFVLIPTLLRMERGSTEFTMRVCRNAFLVTLLLCLALLLSAKYVVVLLYGREYFRVTYALYSILWGIMVTTVYKVIFADFAAKNRLGYTIIAAGVAVLVNLFANLQLIPRYGIVGAGAATSLSYTVLAVILIAFYRRFENVSLRKLFIPDRDDVRSYAAVIRSVLNRIGIARHGR
jgi:O-antigen/teichoic acid export membrane protein